MSSAKHAKRVYEKGSRLYQIGRAKYPSVTSVLNVLDKGGLVPWAVQQSLNVVKQEFKQAKSLQEPESVFTEEWLQETLEKAEKRPDEIKSTSADLGTRAHTAIDEIIRGIEPTIEEDIRPVVEGFQNWYAESGLKMHYAGDTTVYSKKYGYAGALDAVATDAEGYLYVVDFKTSNWIQHSYGLQLAAYAYAYAEMANNGLISPPAPKIEGVNASNKHQPKSRSMSTTGTRRVQKEFSESFTNEEEATQDNVAVRRKEPKSNSSIFHSHTAFTMANTGFMGRGIHMSASSGKNKKSKEQNEAAYPISCPGSIPSIPNQVKSLKEQLQGNPFENQSENLEYDPQLIRPMVVRIDKTTGIVEVRRLSDNDSGFSAFKACLYLWRTFHSLGTYSSSGRAPASPLQVGFELPPGAEDQFLPLVQKFQSTSAPPTIPHVTPEEEFER